MSASTSSDNLLAAFNRNSFFFDICEYAFNHPLIFSLIIFTLLVLIIVSLPLVGLSGCVVLYAGLLAIDYYYRLKSLFCDDWNLFDERKLQLMVAKWFNVVGSWWHAYEVCGMENIPDQATLFVLYHGPIPVDGYYLFGKLIVEKKRILCAVVNRNHFNLPCCTRVLGSIRACPWSNEQCIKILRSGSDLCLLPGGKYESRVSHNTYQIEWENRIGFAKVALQAKVPIVPVFTRNIQEAFWTPWYATEFTRGRFSSKNQYFNLIGGGIPVKLTTFIGKPIYHDENTTAEELARKTKEQLEHLINEKQTIPGNWWRALKERYNDLGQDDDEDEHDSNQEKSLVFDV